LRIAGTEEDMLDNGAIEQGRSNPIQKLGRPSLPGRGGSIAPDNEKERAAAAGDALLFIY